MKPRVRRPFGPSEQATVEREPWAASYVVSYARVTVADSADEGKKIRARDGSRDESFMIRVREWEDGLGWGVVRSCLQVRPSI